jgi:predicted GNAT superfamily acetyltransferase
VPRSILKIAARLDGVVAGAFDGDGGNGGGSLVGFVFGLTGVEDGAIVHWSHMLAVAPEARNHGIGRRLKEFQRDAVAKLGAKTIYWTFDPLVARNAHLNINVLGVRVTEYVEEMYGQSTSPMHRGIGTDRFVVAWPVDDGELARRRAEIAKPREDRGLMRVEVPANVEALQTSDMPSARAWRERTRRELRQAMANGYAVQGFRTEAGSGRAFYLLSR